MQMSREEMAKRLVKELAHPASSGEKCVCVGDIAERLRLEFEKVEINRRVLKIWTSGEPSSELNEEQAETLIDRLLWIHPEVSSTVAVELRLTESEVRNVHNLRKWRGSWENLQNRDAPLLIFEFPNEWFDLEYRQTRRKDVLKDMLLWALRADLIEPLPDISDGLLSRRIIPVKLAARGRMLALEAAGCKVVGWMAGLSEGSIQVKLFAKSDIKGQFNVLHFNLRRANRGYTNVTPEAEEWQYGVIAEWRNSLPKGLIEGLGCGGEPESGHAREPESDARLEEPSRSAMCEECGEREATEERYGYMLCSKCLEEELEDDHATPGEYR